MASSNVIAANVKFMKTLTWIAAFLAISVGSMNITELTIINFIHGNPHRSQTNAIEMMVFFTPIFSLIAFFGVFWIFSVPQYAQAQLAKILLDRFGHNGLYGFAAIIPLATIITWYCFDYLTPSDFNLGINEGPDWTPYRHGLTARRYLMTLGIQTPITLFTLLCFALESGSRRNAKKFLILTMSALAAVAGVIWGYEMAKAQFQFL